MQLDYNDPRTVSLVAARIHALTTAASCIASGSSLTCQMDRQSICDFLLEMAGNAAREIAESADLYEFSRGKDQRHD